MPSLVPTSRDVARLAGVSQATVSRVLAGSTEVSPHTRERVLRAVASTGYQPNMVARAMRTRRSGAVGIVVSDITNPFYPELVDALTAELHGRGKRLVLWNAGAGGADMEAIDAIRQSLVDGLVFTSATDGLVSLEAATRNHAPVVLVNRSLSAPPLDQVLTDNEAGGRLVARYLLAHGRRPAVLAGPEHASTARDRLRGFLTESAAHGFRDIPLVRTDYSYTAGRAGFDRLGLVPGERYGLFCMNDVMALGACDAARDASLSIPEDLWVVGFDDIEAASWSSYRLTTVRQPVTDMARATVALLDERLSSPDAPVRRVVFPAELVVRASTAGAPLR